MNNPASTRHWLPLPPNGFAPPPVTSPRLWQGVLFAAFRRTAMRRWIKRYGLVFEINVPFFGRSVVVADPSLVRSVYTASAEQLVDVRPNLGNWFGPGSMFALDGSRHRARRRLLAPAFHGQGLKDHATIVADATLREAANWPDGEEFRILEPMNRITLNVILRTIFGADESESAESAHLKEIVPPFMTLGSLVAFAPPPPRWIRRRTPWGRLDTYRTAFDRIVLTLVERASADPGLGDRTDVLALLLRSGHGDTGMSRLDVCDEILTLITAGHETTASALAWAFERLRRHPDVVADLVDEVDRGGSDLRRSTTLELLRLRTVLDVVGRRVQAPHFDLGQWRIPHGRTVFVRIADLHENADVFPHPERFEPRRFLGSRSAASTSLAFGGGERRCPGVDFATIEMDVVLRTVLQNFHLHTDDAADERPRFRGVAHVPRRGARVVLTRRTGAGR